MKYISILVVFIIFSGIGCLRIENNPLVTVTPTVSFQGHIRNDSVYINAVILANPQFINPGNIPTVFVYIGKVEIYNEKSGVLLNSTSIEGDGLSTITEIVTGSTKFDEIIVIAAGTVSAYADKESDGDSTNDLFLDSSDFYSEISLTDVINIEANPVVTLDPTVTFQLYISNKQLFATEIIRANPTYIVTGTTPIIFDYDGVIQIYDEISGALLKASAITGEGLSSSVTVFADTSFHDGFVLKTSGTVSVSADIGSDGNAANDLFINSAEFNEIQIIDLTE